MLASICVLTWNREEETKQTLDINLKNAGHEAEILICDNGTFNKEFQKEIGEKFKPKYFRSNKYNEGISRALNQLLIRCNGKHIVWMPNDIILPNDWLKTALECAENLPKAGIIGWAGQDMKHPLVDLDGYKVHKSPYIRNGYYDFDNLQISGPVMLTRSFLNTCGYFCEDLHPYGFEDQDICCRAVIAGLEVFYLPTEPWKHLGEWNGVVDDYRLIKDFCLVSNCGHYDWRKQNYSKIGYYVPPPPLKPDLV